MTTVHFTSDHPSAQDIIDALLAAMCRPGQFVERQYADGDGRYETAEQWQARAAYAVVGPLIEQQRAQFAGREPGAALSPSEVHQMLVAYGESWYPVAPHPRRSAVAPALFAIGSVLLDACDASESLEPAYVQSVFVRHLSAADEH